MGKGEPGGRQGFVSLSVGNQVSGPVGRPLSISVLLAVQLAVPRASRVISRSRSPSACYGLDAFASVPSVRSIRGGGSLISRAALLV